jgi:hypothetical protein
MKQLPFCWPEEDGEKKYPFWEHEEVQHAQR